jgi:hypothetical protein
MGLIYEKRRFDVYQRYRDPMKYEKETTIKTLSNKPTSAIEHEEEYRPSGFSHSLCPCIPIKSFGFAIQFHKFTITADC